MKQTFEDWYNNSHKKFIMKRELKKAWIGCRIAAIKSLQTEAKQSTGRTKLIVKRCARILQMSLGILLMTTSISQADSWAKADTTRQAAYLLVHTIDWLQTKEIARRPNHYETNFILGRDPSQNTVDIYFLSTALLHTLIAYWLPERYRKIGQYITIGIEAGCVMHNYSAGIRIIF